MAAAGSGGGGDGGNPFIIEQHIYLDVIDTKLSFITDKVVVVCKG